METLGALIDRFAIGKTREGNLLHLVISNKSERYKQVLTNVKNQNQDLCKEIDSYIYLASQGKIKNLEEPKNKLYYSEEANIEESESISQHISGLFDANRQLWDLEDSRRDKANSDEDRLLAADLISDFNQKRNQHIDRINQLFANLINKNKT